uniref:TSA: Wollemia nobilis Ref_Wollemi_Transcript_18918_1518 transcribed RNA sequence n=1 Tax=Wollemia nobilis TaxID=56998 RepID=A0A0C9QN82_9CONI
MGGRRLLAIAVIGLAIYAGTDPFRHSPIANFPDFQTHGVDSPPWWQLPVVSDPHNSLQKAEIKFLNQLQGPESLAFDPQGRGPYTGVADGRILFWDGLRWSDFAYTSPNRSEVCNPGPSPMSNMKYEHICGRPLGLRFDKRTGDLYIADAYLGLLVVGPQGGLATSLVREVDGVPLAFTNDLDIDENGVVYFTDSSSKYQRRNFIQLVFSAENSGRILKYNSQTKEVSVLLSNVQFPNGISLSKDGSFFVFSDSCAGRLKRHWLKGPKAGTTDIFAVLPGHPDNVRTNEKGEFWVALHCRRNLFSHLLGLYPRLRKAILKLPIPTKYQYQMHIGGRLHAALVKYSPDGNLLHILEDKEGKVVRAVSEVEEKDGKLWMGSVLMSFVAVY